MGAPSALPEIGELLELDVTAVAHGGHMIARHDGQVVFVRHALPGERVRAVVTDRSKSFVRADAVDILRSAPERIEPACSAALECGGCDFQHVSETGQRELLRTVLSEQLRRIAKEEWDVEVEAIGHFSGWRTRMDWAVNPEGKLGLRQHRRHEVVTDLDCRIAHVDLPPTDGAWAQADVRAVVTSTGQRFLVTDSDLPSDIADSADGVVDRKGRTRQGLSAAGEQVFGRRFELSPAGFWQVHPRAAETLVQAVLDFAQVSPGETVFDLYSGVGLFTRFLAEEVGAAGKVHAIEGSKLAHSYARKNMKSLSQVALHHGPVERVLRNQAIPAEADLIVADPPRAGAKPAIQAIAARNASRIVHIACDPASLARDVTLYKKHGYQLTQLRAFALFPMTHHIECVAMFEPITNVRS